MQQEKEDEKIADSDIRFRIREIRQVAMSSFACFGRCPKDQAINTLLLVIFLTISAISAYGFYSLGEIEQKSSLLEKTVKTVEKRKEEKTEKPKTEIFIPPIYDTAKWKTYQSNWYGFALKYPTDWKGPTIKVALAGSRGERVYSFSKSKVVEEDHYDGFDVIVYNAKKVKEIKNTDEFPLAKKSEIWEQGVEMVKACSGVEVKPTESEAYPAKEIYVPAGDECFEEAFFYSLVRDEYIYNLVPSLKEGVQPTEELRNDIRTHLPEFFSLAATMEIKKIIRPTAADIARAKTPPPVSFKWENGRRVCAKKNDKPSKSKKDKGKHLDMECCLDPDEYPNPHCYYDPAKYGKYL